MSSRLLRFVPVAFVAILIAGWNPGRAQCLEWTGGFEPNGVGGPVSAFAVYDDGTGPALYAGGSDGVAKWDGSSWRRIADSPNSVLALCVWDDDFGQVLVAGGSSFAAGLSYIAAWNGFSWNPLGAGMNSDVQSLAVFDDGSGSGPALYAGGQFAEADGLIVNRIARWNGANWSALGGGTSDAVRALTVFDDGAGGGPALYAGGFFTNAGGASANRIAKWNGTSWSALGSGANAGVHGLAAFDDGTGPGLYACGDFTVAGGAGASRVAKWNGTSWSALASGIGASVVFALAVYDDGSGAGAALHAGGFFPAAGGLPVNNVARWTGASWSPLGRGTSGDVRALGVFDDGLGGGSQLYAGGFLTSAGAVRANHVARWNGSSWSATSGMGLTQPFDNALALAVFDDGAGGGPALYAGGQFTVAGSIEALHIACWNGSSWRAVGDGLDGAVRALTVFDDGAGGGPALYAGGSFTGAGATSARNIARWDGASWSALGSGTDNTVFALAVFDDGAGGGPALYAAGLFTFAGGASAPRIAKWNGSDWSALGSGMDGLVFALSVYDDGLGGGPMLCAAGSFTIAGGVAAKRVARWSGTSWSPLGSGFVDSFPAPVVRALAVFDDGSGSGPWLYAGGDIPAVTGLGSGGIARWNGTHWSPVATGIPGSVRALHVFDDGSGSGNALYVGGAYGTAGGVSATSIARWDGAVFEALGGGLEALFGSTVVFALGSFDDGSGEGPGLYAVGQIQNAGGQPSAGIARWRGCGQPGVPFCFGDGSVVPCPCANQGTSGRGCENSQGTGGARLGSSGWTSLAHESLVLHASGERANALSIFLQGDERIPFTAFGDGLRCTGGNLKRLYLKTASGGEVSAPEPGDLRISQLDAALGDPLSAGSTRYYQVYYRDPIVAFCPAPAGNTWNVSSGLKIVWLP